MDASKVTGACFSRRSQRFEVLVDASHHVGEVVDAFAVEVEELRVRRAVSGWISSISEIPS
jgi:hypothetical protein